MKIRSYLLSQRFLSKLPILLLVVIFLIPIVLLRFSSQAGILFIAFYISYWTVKVFESYYYVLTSYITLLRTSKKVYSEYPIILEDAKQLKHVVIVPVYTEPYDVVAGCVESILANDYPYMQNITILLATEERGGPEAQENAGKIIANYGKKSLISIVNIIHPDKLPHE